MSDVEVFLFSHFNVDHSNDFPALIFSSWFEDRKRPLPIFSPSGNNFMPSTTEFVRDLFSEPRGAYRYLSELVDPGAGGSYQLQPHNVAASSMSVFVFRNADMALYAVSVVNGQVPALAWRVEIDGKLKIATSILHDVTTTNPSIAVGTFGQRCNPGRPNPEDR